MNPFEQEPFLPWEKTVLSTLIKEDENLDAYWKQWSKDWEYIWPNANYDESKAGNLPLPSILVNPETGKAITSPEEWPALRQIHLKNITKIFYGELPPLPEAQEFKTIWSKDVFEGTATERLISLTLHNKGKSHTATILAFIPKADHPVPAIVAMNFPGNHGCLDDKDVPLSTWRDQQTNRGSGKSRWDFRLLTDAGFAVFTCARYDFYPDDILGRKESVFRLFYDEKELTPQSRNLTAISAWAYGYSRIREMAAEFPEIDAKRIWAHGHSRLGKTALWTIANDPEWAGAISNCSGCEGAALSRRRYGELLEGVDHLLSWWTTPACKPYAENPALLPFDAHTIIAMAAPRPILVTSAKEDQWADPMGQFLAVKAAQEIYQFLGRPTLPSQDYPKLQELLMCPSLGYYERYGIHDVTDQDWTYTLRFIEQAEKYNAQ